LIKMTMLRASFATPRKDTLIYLPTLARLRRKLHARPFSHTGTIAASTGARRQ
jgi:hypothetical protein